MTNIIVRLQVEGLHYWKDASEVEPDVVFLANIHRHMFHIKCKAEVRHNDRDIEFILFKREIKQYLEDKYFDDSHNCLLFGNRSCEMIAQELVNEFELNYCSVAEDGENGAEVIKEKSYEK